MHCFTTTFVRTLAIFAITSLAGCDEVDELELDDLDDPRSVVPSTPPPAAIPTDYTEIKQPFTLPMQPVAKLKPKTGFSLHAPTDASYIYTPDPADGDAILIDANGVSPYSNNLPLVEQDVCTAFLATYPFEVPVLYPDQPSCAAVEQGCCDRICYIWGGWPAKENGQNVTVPVKHETFTPMPGMDLEMVWGSYVPPGHLDWNMSLTNGGHSERATACGCSCIMDPEDPGDTDGETGETGGA